MVVVHKCQECDAARFAGREWCERHTKKVQKMNVQEAPGCQVSGCAESPWVAHTLCFAHLIDESKAKDAERRSKVLKCMERKADGSECSNVAHSGYVACLPCMAALAEEETKRAEGAVWTEAKETAAILMNEIRVAEKAKADPIHGVRAVLSALSDQGWRGYEIMAQMFYGVFGIHHPFVDVKEIKYDVAVMMLLWEMQKGYQKGYVTRDQYAAFFIKVRAAFRERQSTSSLELYLPFEGFCGECWYCLGNIRVNRYVLCPKCGSKRCPHASNHTLDCTNSNEPGQPGSIYENVPR